MCWIYIYICDIGNRSRRHSKLRIQIRLDKAVVVPYSGYLSVLFIAIILRWIIRAAKNNPIERNSIIRKALKDRGRVFLVHSIIMKY